MRDMASFFEPFLGAAAQIDASGGVGTPWLLDNTGSGSGAVAADGFQLLLESTSEIQNLCLHFADLLSFDIDKIDHIRFAMKVEPESGDQIDSATTIGVGLGSARNDDLDSITEAALFKITGGSNAVVVETDDGTNDNDDVATGKSVVDEQWHDFVISFAAGKSDVRFFMDDRRVAASTLFDMSNYSGGLQPIFQLQKSADTNIDQVTIGYVYVAYRQRGGGQ